MLDLGVDGSRGVNREELKRATINARVSGMAEFRILRKLKRMGIARVECAHGGMNTAHIAARFSPASNGRESGRGDEIRVLIATDAMSEGQNLQDARVVVNYDLPWAVIRLTQRAGRVDRIGQTAKEILSYSAVPADKLEDILNLRKRLRGRIRQNNEIIGSDERFFHDEESAEKEDRKMRDLFSGKEELAEDDEGETDLISRADEIWRSAVAANPELAKIIPAMPDVCYAAKKAPPRAANGGALAYVRMKGGGRVLVHIGTDGEVKTQSQAEVLKMMECAPEEKPLPAPEAHHELVKSAVRHARESRDDIGGQLGSPRAVRRRVYDRLFAWVGENRETVFAEGADAENVKRALQQIHDHPLADRARQRIGNQLRAHIRDDELARMVVRLHKAGELCETPKNEDEADDRDDPQIICSMGLVR